MCRYVYTCVLQLHIQMDTPLSQSSETEGGNQLLWSHSPDSINSTAAPDLPLCTTVHTKICTSMHMTNIVDNNFKSILSECTTYM